MKKLKNILKSSLIAILLLVPLLTNAEIFKPATLHLGNSRVAVYSKSQADNLFSKGYKLEISWPARLGIAIPNIVANFETSLALAITSTATSSMTLVSGTTDDNTALNGMYGFVIDSGSANQEYVLATCVNTACSALTRGISTVTGNTSIPALQFSHRRGATVKITDHPVLITLSRILNGTETTPGGLTFGTNQINLGSNGSILNLATPNSASTTSAANVQYVNNASAAGGVDASQVSKGISYLSSNPASSTLPIALNSEEVATTTGANKVVRASSTGKIDPTFLNGTESYTFNGATTLTGINSITGTTTMATTTVGNLIVSKSTIGNNATSVGTTTNVVYQNNTTKARLIIVSLTFSGNFDQNLGASAAIGTTSSPATTVSSIYQGDVQRTTGKNLTFVVPAGYYYKIVPSYSGNGNGTISVAAWFEFDLI